MVSCSLHLPSGEFCDSDLDLVARLPSLSLPPTRKKNQTCLRLRLSLRPAPAPQPRMSRGNLQQPGCWDLVRAVSYLVNAEQWLISSGTAGIAELMVFHPVRSTLPLPVHLY